MLTYIASHWGYIVITLLLVLIAAAIIAGMVRERRSGHSGCSCSCKGCANAPYCHPPKE